MVRNHRREIQISLEAKSVKNPVFVGVSVEMIIVAWTHLKGVGWERLRQSEVSKTYTCLLDSIR